MAMVLLSAAGVVGALVWLKKKGGTGQVAQDAVVGAVGVVTDAAAGVPLGIGDAIGLPRTNATLCAQYTAAGDTANASLYCPAMDFVKYLFGSSGSAGTDSQTSAPTVMNTDWPMPGQVSDVGIFGGT